MELRHHQAPAGYLTDFPGCRLSSRAPATYQTALDEGLSGDKAEAAFLISMEVRRNTSALMMLHGAYVLKGAGDRDWRFFATAALLDGRTLGTVPILVYI